MAQFIVGHTIEVRLNRVTEEVYNFWNDNDNAVMFGGFLLGNRFLSNISLLLDKKPTFLSNTAFLLNKNITITPISKFSIMKTWKFKAQAERRRIFTKIGYAQMKFNFNNILIDN